MGALFDFRPRLMLCWWAVHLLGAAVSIRVKGNITRTHQKGTIMAIGLKKKVIFGMMGVGMVPMMMFSVFSLYQLYVTVVREETDTMQMVFDESNARLVDYFDLIRGQAEE